MKRNAASRLQAESKTSPKRNKTSELAESLSKSPTIRLPSSLIEQPKDPENGKFDPSFSCSMIAQVYIRDHSNLNDIFRKQIKAIAAQDLPMEAFTPTMIRAVMSPARRCVYPYDQFRFNSPEEEAVARSLLIHPNICTQNHLDEFLEFNKQYGLKLCTVSMAKNNDVRDDAFKFYRNVQHEKKTKGSIPLETTLLKRYIEQKFYERTNYAGDIPSTTVQKSPPETSSEESSSSFVTAEDEDSQITVIPPLSRSSMESSPVVDKQGEVIIINDSEDENHDESLLKELDPDPNPFLCDIDAGTQLEINIVPETFRHLVRDKEVEKRREALKEIANDQPVASTSTGKKLGLFNRLRPKSKKAAITPIPGGVEYLDDDDSHSPSLNGNKSHSDQLHHAPNDEGKY